jgi:hypothetical protein
LLLPAIAAVLIGGTSLFVAYGQFEWSADWSGDTHAGSEWDEPADDQWKLATR